MAIQTAGALVKDEDTEMEAVHTSIPLSALSADSNNMPFGATSMTDLADRSDASSGQCEPIGSLESSEPKHEHADVTDCAEQEEQDDSFRAPQSVFVQPRPQRPLPPYLGQHQQFGYGHYRNHSNMTNGSGSGSADHDAENLDLESFGHSASASPVSYLGPWDLPPSSSIMRTASAPVHDRAFMQHDALDMLATVCGAALSGGSPHQRSLDQSHSYSHSHSHATKATTIDYDPAAAAADPLVTTAVAVGADALSRLRVTTPAVPSSMHPTSSHVAIPFGNPPRTLTASLPPYQHHPNTFFTQTCPPPTAFLADTMQVPQSTTHQFFLPTSTHVLSPPKDSSSDQTSATPSVTSHTAIATAATLFSESAQMLDRPESSTTPPITPTVVPS
eukprot:jgi/Hompol1/3947/HPOL_006836-RA